MAKNIPAKSVQRTPQKKESKKSRFTFVDGEIDYTFLVIVILIVAAGLVMLLSASAPVGMQEGDPYSFFKKQLLFTVIGFAGMWFVSKIEYKSYQKFLPMFMVICVVLLVAVLIPGVGRRINGSSRWLNTPIIPLQPSEFVKPIIAMCFAYVISSGKYDLKTLRGNAPFLIVIGIVSLLMLLETHLSGTIVIAGIALVVLIAGGAPLKKYLLAGAVVAPLGILVVYLLDAERWSRVLSFLDPFSDMQDTGYQISQALFAIGSGRVFGLGLGESVQKYSYLPEPYNDFIFAIICEELGLVGGIVVILLFLALIFRGVRIILHAPDVYTTLTAIGIVAHIAIQTILNIAVATSSVPNTGVALPFFSYGGTSILTLLIEMGILLNISRYEKKTIKTKKKKD